jgi:serine/threonine-protein kinase
MNAPASSSRPRPAKRRFGGYEVLESLGTLGGVQIFQARQVNLDRTVRLVVLPSGEARKEAHRVRFEREVAVVSNVHHNNVLGAIEAGEINGHRFVVTEDIAGRTLADALAAGRKFEVNEALRIAKEIATALDRFADQGFVHRHITPHAIVLTDAGVAKLAGFSRSKRKQRGGSETWFELDSDEAYYTPPERMKAGGSLDMRGDLYALGCVLHEMLIGKPPFRGSSAAVLESHAKREPRPMKIGRTPIPKPAETVTLNCLQKSRAERYQRPAELIRDLELALKGQSVAQLGTVTTATRPTSKSKLRARVFRKRA